MLKKCAELNFRTSHLLHFLYLIDAQVEKFGLKSILIKTRQYFSTMKSKKVVELNVMIPM